MTISTEERAQWREESRADKEFLSLDGERLVRALAALESAEAERDAEIRRSRSCLCIWCGNVIASYEGLESELPESELARLRDAGREHDHVCSQNPILARLHVAEAEAEQARRDSLKLISVIRNNRLCPPRNHLCGYHKSPLKPGNPVEPEKCIECWDQAKTPQEHVVSPLSNAARQATDGGEEA